MTHKIEIHFLGTGSHMPTAKRNHTGILLSYANENILIDCGEGIQRQLKIAKLNPCRITRILITHWHGDHVLGLPGLLETLAMSNYTKKLLICGPAKIKEKFALLEKLYGEFRINHELKEVSSGKFINEKDFFIGAMPMSHGVPSYAYTFVVKDKRRLKKDKIKKYHLPNSPILQKLQKGQDIIYKGRKIKASSITYLEKGKKITIIMDTAFNKNTIKLAKNSDLLICESSFYSQESDRAIKYKHLTSKQAAEIAKEAKVKELILTHFSRRYKDTKPLEEEARKVFKNTKAAYDFMKVKLK